jgi:hypothetical protein
MLPTLSKGDKTVRITKPCLVAGLALAITPFLWAVSSPVYATTIDTLRTAAAAYEARLNDALLGHPAAYGLSAVEQAGVARVMSRLAALRASGLTVISATSEFTDERASGTSSDPVYSALVIHTFAYRNIDGVTDSIQSAATDYQFASALGYAELATVTEAADGDTDVAVPAIDDSVAPAPTYALRPAADPPGADCDQTDPTYCYDGEAAAAYAAAHACPSCHDSAWHYFDEDCTNFISTALFYGGWQPHGYRKDDYSWWYSTSSNYSYTWTVAKLFHNYVQNSHWADFTPTIESLRLGDVLQADWTGNGTIDHTMMVTKKDSSGIYLSYHSTDKVNRPFAEIKDQYPNALYTGWLIHGTFRNDW